MLQTRSTERREYNGQTMTASQIERRRMYNREKMRQRRSCHAAGRRSGCLCELCHVQQALIEIERLRSLPRGFITVKLKWCGRC